MLSCMLPYSTVLRGVDQGSGRDARLSTAGQYVELPRLMKRRGRESVVIEESEQTVMGALPYRGAADQGGRRDSSER